MNKEKLRRLIIDKLAEDLDILFSAAKAAYEASIHQENLPDNKYDTLSLEASYVAQGQANRAQEIRGALETYRNLELRDFPEDSPIRLTALVTLEDDDGRRTVFIGPEAGGLKVGGAVVITPESPVGRHLLGRVAGDVVDMYRAGAVKQFEIVDVV